MCRSCPATLTVRLSSAAHLLQNLQNLLTSVYTSAAIDLPFALSQEFASCLDTAQGKGDTYANNLVGEFDKQILKEGDCITVECKILKNLKILLTSHCAASLQLD